MSVSELIELLEEHRESFGGDAEVRLMTQQNWPFENRIHGVCSGEEICDRDDDGVSLEDVADDSVFYIVEGGQIGYGSKRAWDCC